MRRHALRAISVRGALISVLCLVVALLLFPTVVVSAEESSYSEECWKADATELSFLEKVNEVRLERGLKPVRLDDHLSRVTQNHSHVMRAEQRLYHTRGAKLYRQVSGEEVLGETVGRGTSSDRLFEAFMQSPAHRNVILTKHFRFLGVGISYDNDGSLWTTLLFESQTNPGTTLRMDPC
jgi:uncharacterized protein YkwD